MLNKKNLSKSLTLSLFVMGAILFSPFVGTTSKAEAQIIPIRSSRIPALLASFRGRWLEIDRRNLICNIYDFKPSGTPGILRTVRFGYALNPVSGQCRFSTGPLAPNFGAISGVPNGSNALIVVYPSGFRERIPVIGLGSRVNNVTQQIVVQRGRELRLWQRSPR